MRTDPNAAPSSWSTSCRFRRRGASRWCAARIDRAHSSLVAAVDAAGETIDLTLALADIFGGEIDFTTEVQPGDHFELSVEKQFREDQQFAGYGPILAAEFTNDGRRVRAVRFTPEGGSPGYYDERGVSMSGSSSPRR